MILKSDKGNGLVLLNKVDYQNAMIQLFSDKTKFKIIKNDPTLTGLKDSSELFKQSVQR